MQNGNIKIIELFNGDRIFNIPKYQRSYAWRVENLEYFLGDLLNQRGDKSYFLGTLLFHQRTSRSEYEVIDVVDGQQRLTTVLIFMKVIIGILQKNSSDIISKKTYSKYIYDGDNYKLELENSDSSFLHNFILGDNDDVNIESPSQARLIESKYFFQKELFKLDKETLEKIYTTLTNSDIILYIVDKISDATQIFELLNDRGRKLTNLEGVKSFLMYRIGCLKLKDNGEQAINTVQDSLSTIYRIIEKNKINENDVLRYHTIAFEKSKADNYNNPSKFIKNKINNMFNNPDITDNQIKDEILGYIERLKASFTIFKDIKINTVKSKHLHNLYMIGRVNPFYPMMMIIYSEKKEKFNKFIKNLTKFTFKASLCSLRSNGESDFYRWIRNKRTFNVSWIKTPIEDDWWNINKRSEKSILSRTYYGKKSEINYNTLKYILFSYENSLRQKKGYPPLTIDNYFSNDSRLRISIEHITAQKTLSLNFDDDFKENYLHSLGNLVIDTQSSNSRKGRKGVDEKMVEFVKAPIMSQNEINAVKIDWDDLEQVKKFIDNRNIVIVSFIKDNLI
ncbi:MAG: DUF262 domain-containing protein [Cocleimonas sp.]|nr:DUF262 domain-containing protein [Cocleimonas sp.]